MSKRTRLGRAGPPVSWSVRSRLSCTRNSVPSRKAPKPIASTTVAVWLAGRCRLASPWRQTYGQPRREPAAAARTSSHAAPQSSQQRDRDARRRRRRRAASSPACSAASATVLATSASTAARPRQRVEPAAARRARRRGARRPAAAPGEWRGAGSAAKMQRDPDAHRRAERDRRPARSRGWTFTGSSPRAGPGSSRWASTPTAAPMHAAGQPHRRGLERRRSRAPGSRSRRGSAAPRSVSQPLADEDHHGARHADATEKQRDQRHQPEIAGRAARALVEVVWSSDTVRTLTRSGMQRRAVAVGDGLRRDGPAGSRKNASYSAREPKPSSGVSGRSRGRRCRCAGRRRCGCRRCPARSRSSR